MAIDAMSIERQVVETAPPKWYRRKVIFLDKKDSKTSGRLATAKSGEEHSANCILC